MRKKIKNI